MTENTAGDITISVLAKEQTLVYFPGDGNPLFMADDMSRADLRDYLPAPVARAVLAARLRTFADMLDDNPLDVLCASAVTA